MSLLLLAPLASLREADAKPNVFVIFADDLVIG
jgi:hypothetical protein